MKPFAAAASSKLAEEAAEEALADRGTAADAVAAAWFALAGDRADVFAAPFSALVAGPAAVGRVFDGRALQAGQGAQKPRGLRADEALPLAAHAAAPRALGAVMLLQASFGARALGRAVQAGSRAAKACGSKERVRLFDRVLAAGAGALPSLSEEVLGVVGRTRGGYVTEVDLTAEATQAEALVHSVDLPEGRATFAEEPGDAALARELGRDLEVIVAVDSRGTLAAAAAFVGCATHDGRSLEIPSLGVAWPLVSVPPRHGEPREKPGTPFGLPRVLAALDAGPSLRLALALAPGAPRLFAPARDQDLGEWSRRVNQLARASVLATTAGASGRSPGASPAAEAHG